MNNSENINLVLVHGLLGSLSFYNPSQYLPNLNLLSPDLHGYGESPLPNHLTLQDQVDYLKVAIDSNIDGPTWLLGHSVGGAIVNLFAAQYPERVAGIINVEGNFTIKDAFWCKSISEKFPAVWEAEYQLICSDPEAWLKDSQITPTPQRVTWAKEILAYQHHQTVQAVATAVVNGTNSVEYQSVVNRVLDSDIPVYLVAGEHSLAGWDIPESVQAKAKKLHVVADAGHMMMLEKSKEFCDLISEITEVELG